MLAFEDAFADLPLIAILRGLRPEAALEVGEALVGAGFRIIEVPLNSPQPFESVRLLAERFGDRASIGAGTVVDVEDVDRVAEAGGRLIVSPHFDRAVTRRAKELGLTAAPGIATPSEAFAALAAGADALKVFPAEMINPAAVKAMRAVLPAKAILIPVGGIGAGNMGSYLKAGANGFGIGGELFKSDRLISELAERANGVVKSFRDMKI